ncbi:MAG: DUF547 domain-containing protein [Chitinophagaceae bacterium]
MKLKVSTIVLFLSACTFPAISICAEKPDSLQSLLTISQSFLYAARTGEEVKEFQGLLENAEPGALDQQLKDDNTKKAFWLNIYNAYVQLLLKENPDTYRKRGQFFRAKQIVIAGHRLSLDKIEHGILRRSKAKWSLGHFNKLFPGRLEKKLRVDKLDYRIHFSLNCGAKSCPPIAYYDADKINQQLSLATKTYIKNEVAYDLEKNIVHLPAIMSWFRRDFGGKKGIKKMLLDLNILPPGANPSIQFKKYDWTLFLGNYKTNNDESGGIPFSRRRFY